MEELIKKLQDAGKEDALQNEEALRAAMKEMGYSDDEIDSAVSEIDFPLDESDLEEVAGGRAPLKTVYKQSVKKKKLKAQPALSTDADDVRWIKC